jgi:hypothetical protein
VPSAISDTWRSNGYRIKNVNLKNQNIIFVRADYKLPVKIPDVFYKGAFQRMLKQSLKLFLSI